MAVFVGQQRGFAWKMVLGVNQPVRKRMGLEASDGNESGLGAVCLNGERLGRARLGRRSVGENVRDVDEVT